jgi:hypothetical protein
MISTTPIELGTAGLRPKVVAQRPNEKKPYRFTVQGGAISSVAWSVAPSGPTISTPVNTSGPSSATSDVLISNLTAGTNYTVECAATLTTSGQIHTGVIVIQGITQ